MNGNIDINKIIVSNKVLFGKRGFKYFIAYKDDRKVTLFCIMLPQTSAYRKDFDEFNYVFFDKRLEKYNRRQKHIKKGFDSELYKMKNI